MATDARETVGDVFDRRGPCALMAAVVVLAERRKRIPVGFWHVALPQGWMLTVNGTPSERELVPPWHARMVAPDDQPFGVVVFNAVDGSVGGSMDTEDRALAVLKDAARKDRRWRLTN